MKFLLNLFKDIAKRHSDFRTEYVRRMYTNLNRLFKLSMVYSAFLLVTGTLVVKDLLEHVLEETVPLAIIGLVGHLVSHAYKRKIADGGLKKKSSLVVGELVSYLLIIAFVLWGNVAINVSCKRDATPTIMVWIILLVLVAAMTTIMPYAVLIINGIALLTTCVQSIFFMGQNSNVEIYNLVMFSFFMVFVMIDKYVYEEYSFRNAAKLKELQDDRERFLVNMTHEMRTPLNAILGKNELIYNDTKEEDTKALAREINASGKVLLSTINDILDLSKMEAGKMTITPVDYSARNITYDVADILKSEALAKGLGFKLEVSANVPSVLHGDDIRIRQVILNLLSNAIKYTKEGSVSLRVWFDYTDRAGKKGVLKVAVVDTGIGIREEDIPNLNKAFSRLDEINTRSIQGTGLGLAITSQILKLMGSELKVESVYEIGSTFSFEVEQSVVDETSLRDSEVAQKTTSRKMFRVPDAKVLVVDDNYVNFSVCKGLMKYYGFEPEHAPSGADCLNRIADKKYDIIFLDHFMPEMDGFETLEKIKTEYPKVYADTPIIALTANDGEGCEKEYKEAGFTGFLTKPIDSGRLHDLLESFLAK